MSRSASREMRCGLCGQRFDAAGLACHASCPLGARCDLICCPRCGFQVVDATKTRLGGWLSRAFGRGRAAPERPTAGPSAPAAPRETILLSHVLPGREVQIVALRDMPGSRLSRLGAFGLVPGSRIEVLQRRPTPVVRVGQTDIAVAAEILDQIEVLPPTLPLRRATGEGR